MDDDYLPGMEAPMLQFNRWWKYMDPWEKQNILENFIELKGLDDEFDEYRRMLWRNEK